MGTSIKEIMDVDLVTIKPDLKVKDAVRLLVQHNIRFLPVVNETDFVVGAVSETDLMKMIMVQPLPTTSVVLTNIPKEIVSKNVSEIMNPRPVTINERAEVKDALNLMYVTNVKELIVTGMDNKISGVVHFRKIFEKMLENI
jgi:predicted transcriptional regulator